MGTAGAGVGVEGWSRWWKVVVVQRWKAVRKVHELYKQAIQINFKAEVQGEISVPIGPEVPRLGKNKYKEVEEWKGITSLGGRVGEGEREKDGGRERNSSRFKLANKKSKAINHVREPSFLAAPSRQRQNEMGQD